MLIKTPSSPRTLEPEEHEPGPLSLLLLVLCEDDGEVEGPVHRVEDEEDEGEEEEGAAVQGVFEPVQLLLKGYMIQGVRVKLLDV